MRVKFYATLRDLIGVTATELPVAGGSDVGQALERLTDAYPALEAKLWRADGAWSGYVTVMVNGRSVQFLQGLRTPLKDRDVLALFPPVGGGCR